MTARQQRHSNEYGDFRRASEKMKEGKEESILQRHQVEDKQNPPDSETWDADHPSSSRTWARLGDPGERNLSPSYLQKPVAPSVKRGDDGGMDVAAIQALGTQKERKQSQKLKTLTEDMSRIAGFLAGNERCKVPYICTFHITWRLPRPCCVEGDGSSRALASSSTSSSNSALAIESCHATASGDGSQDFYKSQSSG
ncbi:hypothetical protein BTVI_40502 [Pitangus sulphuratus]|nr:hypothetical protein BTVI_40502 [Pitangus sulphuratus]